MHAWIHEYLLNSVPVDKRGSEKQSQSYYKYISLAEEEEEEDMDGELEAAVMVSGGVKCGRWNPTAEQVKVLMDLFKAGLRTPSTEEIQSITTHLSSYGKIESKNVFYWFQNHKARERHHKKRRRGATPATSPVLTAPTKNHEQVMVWEQQERKIETLELFPLKSYDLEVEKMKVKSSSVVPLPFFDAGRDLLLDLRLSFL